MISALNRKFVDVEKLIFEVGKRPALYRRNSQEKYNEKHFKQKLWMEICEAVFEDWDNFSNEEKTIRMDDVLRKWRNIRDSYRKDLQAQKKEAAGQPVKRKRKYLYADQLWFLTEHLKDEEEETFVINQDYSFDKDDVERSIPVTTNGYQNKEKTIGEKEKSDDLHNVKKPPKKHRKKSKQYEKYLLKILKEEIPNEMNEDKSFLLSLLPSFAKLNGEQKLIAKGGFLNVLRQVTYCQQCDFQLNSFLTSSCQQHSQLLDSTPLKNTFVCNTKVTPSMN